VGRRLDRNENHRETIAVSAKLPRRRDVHGNCLRHLQRDRKQLYQVHQRVHCVVGCRLRVGDLPGEDCCDRQQLDKLNGNVFFEISNVA
jgi:hypothetical protein